MDACGTVVQSTTVLPACARVNRSVLFSTRTNDLNSLKRVEHVFNLDQPRSQLNTVLSQALALKCPAHNQPLNR